MGEGLTTLFALAVAFLNETVGFLGYVLFQEVGVLGDHGFQAIIEPDGSGVEIAVGRASPFGLPDRADTVGVPVLASIAIDSIFV